MQHVGDTRVFAPTDLNHFLECEHLIRLDALGAGDARTPRDAHAELLAAKGLAHERAWLERFRAEGRRVIAIDPPPGERDWHGDAETTLAAMRDGADVVYQGVLVEEGWHGIGDFLVRVETPSAFGAWSYEAWDTKLARHTKPYFVLQLCFYSGQLARLQERDPARMHVILGTGEADHLHYADFAAYYRAVRRRFLNAVSSGQPTYPYPVSHCALCDHARRCEAQWEDDDHLSRLAGITHQQVQRLNAHGIQTVAQLARTDPGQRLGIGRAALDRLRHQARLQDDHRRTGIHRYELLPLDERTGFRLLPEPSPGDIFFDMEGDPYFEPGRGLEYLFGAITVEGKVSNGLSGEGPASMAQVVFHAFQALDRDEEQAAFERFIDFVHERLARDPSLHVYHYAAYETTALKRLMSEHATREDALDDLLRREVFVDLYQVVRQSVRISHASYSIKKVRTFFMDAAGRGQVSSGGDSILEFERWRDTGDPAILRAIAAYNREDCVSTLKLRDWLLGRKRDAEAAAGVAIPWKVTKASTVTPEREEEDAQTAARRLALEARGDAASIVLARLLGYHRREAKPEWWAYFDRQRKSLDDLLDDTQAIAFLDAAPDAPPRPQARSLVHTLSFPDQEFKLDAPDDVEDPFRGTAAGSVVWLDAAAGCLGLKRGPTLAHAALPAAIVSAKPLDTREQRSALSRVADAVLAGEARFRAARALLARERPRVRGRMSGDPIQTLDLEAQRALVSALDESCLFVQGPPGSGKTWTGARLIVALMRAGARLGVAATSHKAIHNLLDEVEAVAAAAGVAFKGVKKCTGGTAETQFRGASFENVDEPRTCERSQADLIAGTAWLFARQGMEGRLDYLFIDEAGQVSLADAVAMSTASRNVVLLGDPQQLPHVTQGVHPEGSGSSVLEHLLGGERTVSEDRGLFLARSWRMHPDLCGFVSELSYEGRLTSAEGRERQRIDSPGLRGTGLRFLPVPHAGNAQQSSEEAAAVADQVRGLLAGGTFTDETGRTRPLDVRDILVVAPYNMHVRCLRDVLPDGVEAGTVDKFQGREAPVVFFSMASSSGEDVPRGLEFLFSRNRFNVAISRGRALAVLVCSPRLLDVRCRTVEQMRLVNAVCRFVERAEEVAQGAQP